MFIKQNSTVELVLFYKRMGMHYIAYSDADFKNEELTDEERGIYKKLTIQMKQLTWGLYNELQEGSSKEDDEGNNKFCFRKYKELRLTRLISSWDATALNDKDEVVPVKINDETIKSLAPEIAETILNAYDELMFLTEEEEKK
jgi:hypothetical protein